MGPLFVPIFGDTFCNQRGFRFALVRAAWSCHFAVLGSLSAPDADGVQAKPAPWQLTHAILSKPLCACALQARSARACAGTSCLQCPCSFFMSYVLRLVENQHPARCKCGQAAPSALLTAPNPRGQGPPQWLTACGEACVWRHVVLRHYAMYCFVCVFHMNSISV
jgi:hypothetical protein